LIAECSCKSKVILLNIIKISEVLMLEWVVIIDVLYLFINNIKNHQRWKTKGFIIRFCHDELVGL